MGDVGEHLEPPGGDDVSAMTDLGISLYQQGDAEQAERWLTAVAESGSEAAMTALARILIQKDEPNEAEPWLRAPTASGDPDAMYYLTYILKNRDIEAAEVWGRRAAQAGHIKASTCSGICFGKRETKTKPNDIGGKQQTPETGHQWNASVSLRRAW